MGCTPALARLSCLEGADESSDQKAETHLLETGGIRFGARQIQRLVQRVGAAAQAWQEREAQPGGSAVPIMEVSADGPGVPLRKEELVGRAGKQANGSAKTRLACLGCVFTQHQTDEEGHPVRDYESTTCVSSFGSIEEFGPSLRQDAIRHGLALALQLVLLIDGAESLANLGRTGRGERPGAALHSEQSPPRRVLEGAAQHPRRPQRQPCAGGLAATRRILSCARPPSGPQRVLAPGLKPAIKTRY
jgi:hypothetical protein